jgi:hypothetical protein
MLKGILQKLLALFRPGNNKAVRIKFCAVTTTDGIIVLGELTMSILLATQEIDLAIQPLDKKGNPAQIDGIPAWMSSNPSAVAVIPAADGLSCVAKAGVIGASTVTVTADANLGSGVTTISGTYEINVAAGEAVTIGIIAGTPREQA